MKKKAAQFKNIAKNKISRWYNGIVVHDKLFTSGSLVFFDPRIKRHWTANIVHSTINTGKNLPNFVLKHWEFCFSIALTLIMAFINNK